MDEQRTVVYWVENLPPDPCGLSECDAEPARAEPPVMARYVVELLAGTTGRFGLAKGDVAYW